MTEIKCARCKQIVYFNTPYKFKTCEKCRIECNKRSKLYYYNNIDHVHEYKKRWAQKNADALKKYRADWYVNNIEKVKKYRLDNKHIENKKQSIRQKNRRNKDINFRILGNLRARVRLALKSNSKSNSIRVLLGCSINNLKIHLEKQFKDGMSWDNYGRNGWVIDHIIPCIMFDLNKEDEQCKCFHYTNLQPLWEIENLKKGSKCL